MYTFILYKKIHVIINKRNTSYNINRWIPLVDVLENGKQGLVYPLFPASVHERKRARRMEICPVAREDGSVYWEGR